MQFVSTYIFFARWLAGVRVYVYGFATRLILHECITTSEQELSDEKKAARGDHWQKL